VALGKKLVEELDLEPCVDTLGRWMAHYIADQIATAESATGEEKKAAQNACFSAILKLWAHRSELPSGTRPFREFEPIVRAIESLDPDNETPRYYRAARPSGDDEKEPEAKAWLSAVDGLDYSAKVLIGYFLSEAARVAVDKTKVWVKLAEAAGVDDGPSGIVVRFVTGETRPKSDPDPIDVIREQIENRISRLEGFADVVRTVVDLMKNQIKALPPPKKRLAKQKPKPKRGTKTKLKKAQRQTKLRKSHKGSSR